MSRARYLKVVGVLATGIVFTGCQSKAVVSPAVDSSVATRTVEHAKGKTEVPISPKRVVVVDTAPLDAALALGIEPVGTIIYGQAPNYLGEKVDEISIVGESNQPNLEKILQLKPDLILGSKIGSGKIYRQLSQIAPTVLTKGSGRTGEWQENFRLYAEALGKSEQAAQLLQNYDDQVEQLRKKIQEPQALEISVLATSGERIGAYTTGSFSGSILKDIGLSRNPSQDFSWHYGVPFSREALSKLDGDYIFLIYSSYLPGGLQKNDFVTEPIWAQLKAVQQNHVCEVAGEVWAAGRSLLAAHQILTDVEDCLI